MCGIAGLVGLAQSIARPRLDRALAALYHRGPDGVGIHTSDAAVIGMRRLAIVDLFGGDQPIYNEDRNLAVVCNGELYNYVEQLPALERRGHRLQSRSDINMIPHLYEENGIRAFDSCRGMFAAAIWDERSKRLVLARDRVGKKPLFYSRVDHGLAFASELPALLELIGRTPSHSPQAIAAYLRLGCVPHPDTIYENVFAVPPGCTLSFTLGGDVHIDRYWEPTSPAPFRGTLHEAIDEVDRRLREAVAFRLRSDVEMGLFLSGGIDSGLVASYAAELGARDLLCFVVEVADAQLNEAPAARLVAQHLGLPIQTIAIDIDVPDLAQRIPKIYGQPFADSSAIPSFLVSRAARPFRKAVLNGDGGDEIFAGYRRYWLSEAARYLVPATRPIRTPIGTLGDRLARGARRRSGAGFASRALRGLGTNENGRYLRWTTDLLGDTESERLFPVLAALGDPLDRIASQRGYGVSTRGLHAFQRSDYRLNLADDLLVKMDIATMANSVEARSPFLDVPLAEFAWSLPAHWLITRRETKPILRAIARKRLPAAIGSAPKRGFEAPVARWIANDLKPLIRDTVLAPTSRVGALGDPKAIRSLVERTDGFAGNYTQTVWMLLMLELFLRG